MQSSLEKLVNLCLIAIMILRFLVFGCFSLPFPPYFQWGLVLLLLVHYLGESLRLTVPSFKFIGKNVWQVPRLLEVLYFGAPPFPFQVGVTLMYLFPNVHL